MDIGNIVSILPPDYRRAAAESGVSPTRISEFRLRAGACSAVTYIDTESRMRNSPITGLVLSEEDLRGVLTRLCRGSVHAYDASLRRGYFTPFAYPGVRVGVAGRVLCENGQILQLQRLTSLCIRIPHFDAAPPAELERLGAVLRGEVLPPDTGGSDNDEKSRYLPKSTLFYAPPGMGKTTLLRAVIRLLADTSVGGGLRVCVLDSGEEIGMEAYMSMTVDTFSAYPRGIGMAIATRCFTPEVLIADEIGDDREAEEILRAQGTGVPLIATAHADTYQDLLRRPAFARLLEHGVFSRYIRIGRNGTSFSYTEEEHGGNTV